MPSFKKNEFEIREQGKKIASGHNIVTVKTPPTSKIQSFKPSKIQDDKGIIYSAEKSKFTDLIDQKNIRFQIDELARGPLSIEIEEESRIQGEISERLSKKLKEIQEQVSKQAYDAGYKAGTEKAKQDVFAENKPHIDRITSLVSEFEQIRSSIFKANEELFTRIVFQISKAVILKELKTDTEYLKRLTTELISKLETRDNIKIFIDQEAYSAQDRLKGDLAKIFGELKNVSIELDSSMKMGGCRIETEFGEINAAIEVQLQSIEQGLGIK